MIPQSNAFYKLYPNSFYFFCIILSWKSKPEQLPYFLINQNGLCGGYKVTGHEQSEDANGNTGSQGGLPCFFLVFPRF